MATSVTPVLGAAGGGGGGNRSRVEIASTMLIDKKAEQDSVNEALIDLRREACDLLNRLDDDKHYKVLHRRYILYRSFENIAVEMGYSYRNILYLHGRALQAFERVLEERK